MHPKFQMMQVAKITCATFPMRFVCFICGGDPAVTTKVKVSLMWPYKPLLQRIDLLLILKPCVKIVGWPCESKQCSMGGNADII